MYPKPATRPASPFFSCGPTRKHPGWSLDDLAAAVVGRSHRSAPAKAKIEQVIALIRSTLEVPSDWRIGIVPASNTGAFEMALWNLLGARAVDVLAFDAFSKDWAEDITEHLALADARVLACDYGELPDLSMVDAQRDIVFAWNGTTAGVSVPGGDWISPQRGGLAICDATSAVYAQPMPWHKLDVVTFSWQKVLGGEAAHGVLMLSPRASERLGSYQPPRPLPKIFRLTKNGKIIENLYAGATINTISMLCIEDVLTALRWVKDNGGLSYTCARCEANAALVYEWAEASPWLSPLVQDANIRSNTSVCLSFSHPSLQGATAQSLAAYQQAVTALLEREGVAYDVAAYRAAPAGLRIWTGASVEADDIQRLLPWLDWACAMASSRE